MRPGGKNYDGLISGRSTKTSHLAAAKSTLLDFSGWSSPLTEEWLVPRTIELGFGDTRAFFWSS
jgi:hypothetical protein